MHTRVWAVLAVLATALATISLGGAPSQAGPTGRFVFQAPPGRPQLSGVADPNLLLSSKGVVSDALAARSAARVPSDDVQTNADNKANATDQFGSGEGLPANETAIAINPTDPNNVIAGTNDYEPAVDATMGLYVSFDGGHTWPYSRHARQVVTPDRSMYGSGDPVIGFDREGVAYAAFISFGRANCDSYIAVIRSEDGGVTWTAPYDSVPGGTGVTLGDGIVAHNGGPDDCQIFHDKEWMASGRRPAGAALVPGTDQGHVSPDRLYVSWTRFDSGPDGTESIESPIYVAYSDDQGRHWSAAKEISGQSSLCPFQTGDADAPACDEDQFSVPVVDARNGTVHVAFQNFNVNSTEKSQYLIVTSTDGGATWGAPRFVSDVFDGADKYPVCNGRQTLDLMCARVNAAGNIDIDARTGQLYVTFADNRNGTAADTNTDVFVTTSTNGGGRWSRPRNVTQGSVDDQWFPWLSVAPNGTVAVTYFDRRYSGPKLIDTSLSVSTNRGSSFSTRRVSEQAWNPDLAFRLGIFIGDYNGLDTSNGVAIPFWTDARFAEPDVAGNNPPHQQSDVMADAEPLP